MRGIPDGMRGRHPLAADLHTVPVDVVFILYRRHQNRELQISGSRPGNIEVAPVPRKAGIRRMGLRSPAIVSSDVLPLRVVIGGRGPTPIIAKVKLPFAINRRRSPADVLDIQNIQAIQRRRTMGFLSYGWLRGSNNRRGHKQQQREQNTQGAHTRSLTTSVRPWALASVRSQPLAQLPATVVAGPIFHCTITSSSAPNQSPRIAPMISSSRFLTAGPPAYGSGPQPIAASQPA